MFEDRTYENILAECLASASADTDTRQGSIFYDSVSAACLKIAQLYADLNNLQELIKLPSATGEYLDAFGGQFMLARHPAASARYHYIWSGNAAPVPGDRFFAGGLYFTVGRTADLTLYLEADLTGTQGNNIASGTNAVPISTESVLASSVFGSILELGADEESDDDYRERIQEKIAGPAENGNRQHYKTWCESVGGCGAARIVPLFAGDNTVMGVIIGVDGTPASQAVIDQVQQYIDPITKGLTATVNGVPVPIGDGTGDGAANIGAHFLAVPPTGVGINISFAAEMRAGVAAGQVEAAAKAAITSYLKDLALQNTPPAQGAVLRISAIGNLLYGIDGLIDYSGLAMNGSTANIDLAVDQVAVMGEVHVGAVVRK